MARLASIEKLGYYPTPPKTLSLICQALWPAQEGALYRLIDPCAGQGEALAALARSLQQRAARTQTIGVEIADSRAPIAAQLLDTCIHADIRNVSLAHNAASCLFLNPPYDTEAGNDGARKLRLEFSFLRDTFHILQPGGLLIYIVPVVTMANKRVATFLSQQFEEISLYRLPDDEYEMFEQCVLFATKRQQPGLDSELEKHLHDIGNGQTELSPLDQAVATRRTIPQAQLATVNIRKIALSYDDLAQAAISHGVHQSKAWQRWTAPPAATSFTPLIPMRVGHIASLIGSGQMGTVLLGEKLVKGYSDKIIDYYDQEGHRIPPQQLAALTPDKIATVAPVRREQFVMKLFTLTAQGQHQQLITDEDLQHFIGTNAAAIAQILAERYTPLYERPTAAEWRKLAPIFAEKRLPGRDTGGLLPAQKHMAIAAARSCQQHGYVNLIADMGCGVR